MQYQLIRSKRKTVCLEIDANGVLLVRAPRAMRKSDIDTLIQRKSQWIARTRERMQAQPKKSDQDIPALTQAAQQYLPKRVEYYSALLGVTPTGVRITKAKKRFGSCSANGHVCFSCFLMLYPTPAIDYVVVHELAHLKELNHSQRFYRIIASVMPDYQKRIQMLK